MFFRSFNALRTFSIAAQTLSFTDAAVKLNLTKGAVSYQIKQLEEELGFAVFSRSNGRVHLTPRGAELVEISQRTLTTLCNEITNRLCNPTSVTLI
ncbi:MAG: LysR family transcriptional regulator [Gammaproteobacteria bacterium]|nr:LysR family transcriptional regulator [Gammaproteobacteria bacterium]